MSIAYPEPRTSGLLPVPSEQAVESRVAGWVNSLGYAAQAADMIVDTAVCPDAWWPLPPNVRLWNIPDRNPRVPLPNEDQDSYLRRRKVAVATGAVILSAAESLGLRTLASAVTGVYVVGGKPTLYAETMLALLHGFGWRSRMIERSATRGAVAFWRHDEPEDNARVYDFTMEQAITAGYVKGKGPNERSSSGGDKGGNAQYDLRPEAMLYWRAVSIGCRLEAPELLKGMQSTEEMTDAVSVQQEREPVPVTVTQVREADVLAPRPVAREAAQETAGAASEGTRTPSGPIGQAVQAAAPRAATDPVPEPSSSGGHTPAVADMDTGERKWRDINARFVQMRSSVQGLTGPGQQSARLRVVGAIVERTIQRGSDLTPAEADQVLDNLAGPAGERLARAVLAPATPEQARAEQPAEPVAAPAEHDPTTDDDWPRPHADSILGDAS